MGTLSIDHVQLQFHRLYVEKVRTFYGALLGLTEIAASAQGSLRYGLGNQRLDFIATDEVAAPPSAVHVALRVDDLGEVRDRLQEAGYPINQFGDFGGHTRFYTLDPVGNTLEIVEPASALSSR
ncbi:MAG: glyoxalase [Burkholderiales bacterium]|nr:MAG: glyoxalase [Burkholderiales bacterium]TAG78763.1 MAG: glyoxalase [Betaproteobacteria bacterium]